MGRKQDKTGNENLRFERFKKFYAEGGAGFRPGNAYQSAIAAGYSEATARSNCHLLAARCQSQCATALRVLGADEFYLAKRIVRLTQAKTVKWNPAKSGTRKKPKGGWDVFEDNDTQLGATRELGKFLNAYPLPEVGDNRPVQIIFPGSFANLTVKAAETHEERNR